MDVSSVTVGLPVSDLDRAVAWYRRVLQLGEPDDQTERPETQQVIGHAETRQATALARLAATLTFRREMYEEFR